MKRTEQEKQKNEIKTRFHDLKACQNRHINARKRRDEACRNGEVNELEKTKKKITTTRKLGRISELDGIGCLQQ